jgi:hypothetical protein
MPGSLAEHHSGCRLTTCGPAREGYGHVFVVGDKQDRVGSHGPMTSSAGDGPGLFGVQRNVWPSLGAGRIGRLSTLRPVTGLNGTAVTPTRRRG